MVRQMAITRCTGDPIRELTPKHLVLNSVKYCGSLGEKKWEWFCPLPSSMVGMEKFPIGNHGKGVRFLSDRIWNGPRLTSAG